MRRARVWRAARLGVMLAVTLAAAEASADDPVANQLFQEGREALARGDLETACAKFAKSAEIEPRVGTYLNLAQCDESRDRLVLARAHWSAALELARKTGDPRESVARDRLAALDPRIPTLSVHLDGPVAGATVTCDGAPVASGKLGTPLPLDPGAHTVVVAIPGRPPTSTTVVLKQAERRDVTISVAAPPPSPIEVRAPREASSLRSGLAWTLGGLAVAAIGVGSWYGVRAIGLKNDSAPYCDAANHCQSEGLELRSESRSDARISTIGFALGGVALTGAIVLFATAPRTPSAPAIGLAVTPTSFSLQGRF